MQDNACHIDILRIITVRIFQLVLQLISFCYRCIGFLSAAAFIVAMGFMDCQRRHLAVVFLTLGVAVTACGRSAYPINHLDIAPRWVHTFCKEYRTITQRTKVHKIYMNTTRKIK